MDTYSVSRRTTRDDILRQIAQFLRDADRERLKIDEKLSMMTPQQRIEVMTSLDYMDSIQFLFKIKEISDRMPSLTYSSIHWALSGSNNVEIKKREQPRSLSKFAIFVDYTDRTPKYRYEPALLVHHPKPDTIVLTDTTTTSKVTHIPTYPEPTTNTIMPPVVEKVIERVEVPVEKVIVEPCKRAHLPIALYDPLMAKLSNRMGTWRFDDGWHIVEKFLDSESNEEPQRIVGWVGVTQQELELLKKSFPRKDWFTDGKPIKVTPPD
jgi:hypothetical protein